MRPFGGLEQVCSTDGWNPWVQQYLHTNLERVLSTCSGLEVLAVVGPWLVMARLAARTSFKDLSAPDDG
jgi:hypothetical protein